MTDAFDCRIRINNADLETVIAALRSSKGDSPASSDDQRIARYLERQLEADKILHDHEKAYAAERDKARAERAAAAVLTKERARVLASVRAKMGAFFYWDASHFGHGAWRQRRNMGGAARRMVTAMIEDGLLTERRELTPEGARWLDIYEQKHGVVAPRGNK